MHKPEYTSSDVYCVRTYYVLCVYYVWCIMASKNASIFGTLDKWLCIFQSLLISFIHLYETTTTNIVLTKCSVYYVCA